MSDSIEQAIHQESLTQVDETPRMTPIEEVREQILNLQGYQEKQKRVNGDTHKHIEKLYEDEERNKEQYEEQKKFANAIENKIVLIEKTLEFTNVVKP